MGDTMHTQTASITTSETDGQGEGFVKVADIPSPNTTTLISRSPDQDDQSPPAVSPLLRLPSELLSLVLSHVPTQQYQRTALALHKVFPGHHLADEHLWRHVIVRRGDQLMPLWKAARKRREQARDRLDQDRRDGASVGVKRANHNDHDDEIQDDMEEEEDEDGHYGRLALGKRMGVQSFAMESWRGDADLLNNALRCLPHIPVMRLNLGTNFAPEHLEDMFDDARTGIERLEILFRPYVEQASYYQFLKGSYFDSAIETLTHNWPEVPSFTQLSIVQDLPPRSTAPPTARNSLVASAMTSAAASVVGSQVPSASTSVAHSTVASPHAVPQVVVDKIAELHLDPASASTSSDDESSDHSTPPTSVSDSPVESKGYTGHGPFPYLSERIGWTKPKSFAQPIVFFDIECLARLGNAAVARNLTHLRLRVPSRNIAGVLCGPMGISTHMFPSLRHLDISTTNVRLDAALSTLMKQYELLEHLVLDRVNLFGFQAKDKGPELCRDLGGMMLSACLARGKERERAIVQWDTAERARIARAQAEAASRLALAGSAGGSGSSSSNGGGAQSLIDQAQREAQAAAEERERQVQLARSRRGHRSAAQSTFSLRDRPSRLRNGIVSSSSASSLLASIGPLPPSERLYLVLPPLPALKTLCIGGEAQHVSSARTKEWSEEFHTGWREGLVKLHGWAGHIGERYERAKKKADDWVMAEARSAMSTPSSVASGSGAGGKKHHSHSHGNGKGKASSSSKTTPTTSKPPIDVRLYRYPTLAERLAMGITMPAVKNNNSTDGHHPDPTEGLIELHPIGREYLEPYQSAIADAELHANDYSYPPPCVLCTTPDCEGPSRRGDEGGRVDGRGGMDGKHREGCGHLIGRKVWGWDE